MSRLAHSGPHLLASFETAKAYLEGLVTKGKTQLPSVEVSIKKAEKLLRTHAEDLLGPAPEGRHTRIMVTMPSEAAENLDLVLGLRQHGMNLARINCAHDDAAHWSQMIAHLRAEGEGEIPLPKVAMDLAGPKIRTGPIVSGPKVRRFKPRRDVRGRVIQPARVWLSPLPPPSDDLDHLPIASGYLEQLRTCSKLNFRDTRGKMRALKIREIQEAGVIAETKKTCYVETDLPLMPEGPAHRMPILVGELPPVGPLQDFPVHEREG
ncbi:MAG: hypothetical protein AAF399_27205, partial [Bacteroidota bacterium]